MAKRSAKLEPEVLQKLRTEAGLTQEDLAGETHLSLRTIQTAEAGDPVDLRTIGTIATYFDVDHRSLISKEPMAKERLVVQFTLSIDPATLDQAVWLREWLATIIKFTYALDELKVAKIEGMNVSVDMSREDIEALIQRITSNVNLKTVAFREKAKIIEIRLPDGTTYGMGESITTDAS